MSSVPTDIRGLRRRGMPPSAAGARRVGGQVGTLLRIGDAQESAGRQRPVLVQVGPARPCTRDPGAAVVRYVRDSRTERPLLRRPSEPHNRPRLTGQQAI
ncbi:hypothetical protein GCM10012285_10660 [Streptomyces kronopolitis]|uniref:Uncharacterized protein n=1 Tax=Streptomyces kronopolitis TaxID=1612435 RepID=A0ABQ2J0B3_9ACTN|nr:hypothetical protein GCM10012285_10660 [Streptomyces kronopolitis]